jgi:ESF2/ABP1 family protein
MERGIVYLSRVPPYMDYKKVRKLFANHGEIDNVFLKPEPKVNRQLRKKHGGNTRKSFTEGWIEFLDKSVAKNVAASFNNQPTGGKKRRNFYREDIWNIRYLPKFKWEHLEQKMMVDKMLVN